MFKNNIRQDLYSRSQSTKYLGLPNPLIRQPMSESLTMQGKFWACFGLSLDSN